MDYEIKFGHGSNGKPTNVGVTVECGDEIFTDVIDVAKEKSRNDFCERLIDRWSGLSDQVDVIQDTLIRHSAKLLNGDNSDNDVVVEPLNRSKAEIQQTDDKIIEAGRDFLRTRNLMSIILDHVERMGVVGERDLTCALYLVMTSRILKSPLAAEVIGESSAGKSFAINTVGKLFPDECVLKAHRLTPKALDHIPYGRLKHCAVIAGERSRNTSDEQAEATRSLREMLSDGVLRTAIPEKDKKGRHLTVYKESPGPISYVESTTLGTTEIFDEDKTRMLFLCADESEQQSRNILKRQADDALNPSGDDTERNIITLHHTAQRLLKPAIVKIPFSMDLIDSMPTKKPESRRAFSHLLNLIRASAILHQYQRDRDGDIVIADIQDYAIIYEYLSDAIGRGLGATLTAGADSLFEVIKDTFESHGEFTAHELKELTGLKNIIYDRLRELRNQGLVELREPSQGAAPSKYALTMFPTKTNLELPEPKKIGGQLCPI